MSGYDYRPPHDGLSYGLYSGHTVYVCRAVRMGVHLGVRICRQLPLKAGAREKNLS